MKFIVSLLGHLHSWRVIRSFHLHNDSLCKRLKKGFHSEQQSSIFLISSRCYFHASFCYRLRPWCPSSFFLCNLSNTTSVLAFTFIFIPKVNHFMSFLVNTLFPQAVTFLFPPQYPKGLHYTLSMTLLGLQNATCI